MRELNFAGLTDDGFLRLTSSDGAQYSLSVDERLVAAVRGDRPRVGQLSIAMAGATPRDIQMRVRHGQTAEEIAATTGLPLEHVERFAGPPLAEREHVAQRAREAVIRSVPGSRTLESLLLLALVDADVDAESIEWDTWREEDGSWTLLATWARGERTVATTAHWRYDAGARTVVPLDATATALHATFAPDEVASVEETVSPEPQTIDETADVTEPPTLRVIEGNGDDGVEQSSHDWGDDADPDAALTAVVERYSGDVVDLSGHPDEPDTALEDLLNTSPGISDRSKRTTKRPAPRSAPKSRKRAAVPTWDEILFGAKTPDGDKK